MRDEQAIEDYARRAILAWASGKSESLLKEFANLAEGAGDTRLLWFRGYLMEFDEGDHLWEVLERVRGLHPVREDALALQKEGERECEALQEAKVQRQEQRRGV